MIFCLFLEPQDNELLALEVIQKMVDALDDYFENVCELDIIFNFIACQFIKNELLCNGSLLNYGDYSIDKHMKNQDFMQLTDYQTEKKIQSNISAGYNGGQGEPSSTTTPDYNFLEHIFNTPYGYSGITPFSVRLPRQ